MRSPTVRVGVWVVVAFSVVAGEVFVPTAPGRVGPPTFEAAHVITMVTKARRDARPDLVLIVMDDFSLELLATMRRARQMKAEGASYKNAFVVDSLCCPSRAAIFTGRPPHQTGVLTNNPNHRRKPIGGFDAFAQYGNIARSFNVTLQQSGYVTGFVGKYMNGYDPTHGQEALPAPPKVRGWSEWEAILDGGYNGWGFHSTRLRSDGTLVLDAHRKPALADPRIDRYYATNVAAQKAVAFIRRHRSGGAPYFLEVAVFGPHYQLDAAYRGQPLFPSAMADRAPVGNPGGGNCGPRACSRLRLSDLVGYDDARGDNAPTYLLPDGTTRPRHRGAPIAAP